MILGTSGRLAWRNLWRNRRRTGLALTAIALSVTLVLAYTSILRAYEQWVVATLTGPMLGHVQIHAAQWRKDRLPERTVRSVGELLDVVRGDPGVGSATARVYVPALAAREEEGFAVIVMGLDPLAESGPARLLGSLGDLPRGRQALVGRQLAEQMGVRAGEKIAIVGQGIDGSLASDLFTVTAVVATAVDLINRQAILIDLSTAQDLFAMPGEAHEIVVHVRDAGEAAAVAARLSAMPVAAPYEVLDWQRLAPEMVSLVELTELAGIFVLVLVFVAAAAGVANTMMMATFERTREFGMLLALGTHPSRLVRLIVAESFTLGLIGALIGSGVGVVLVAVTHQTGIDYSTLAGRGPSELSFAGLRWSLRFYPSLAPGDVVRTITAVCVTALVASMWPAMRVSRLQPARALRGT
jgi:ABC-type lipoprotein release transport system permease subunit